MAEEINFERARAMEKIFRSKPKAPIPRSSSLEDLEAHSRWVASQKKAPKLSDLLGYLLGIR